jgi:hypothetical protein
MKLYTEVLLNIPGDRVVPEKSFMKTDASKCIDLPHLNIKGAEHMAESLMEHGIITSYAITGEGSDMREVTK